APKGRQSLPGACAGGQVRGVSSCDSGRTAPRAWCAAGGTVHAVPRRGRPEVHLRSDKAGQEPLERPLRPSPQPGPALPLTELMSEGKARPEAVAELQRSAGNAAVAQLLADDRQGLGNEEAAGNLAEAMASAGQPLDHEIRQGMESALGADLGSVRVHTGAEAHRSAQ